MTPRGRERFFPRRIFPRARFAILSLISHCQNVLVLSRVARASLDVPHGTTRAPSAILARAPRGGHDHRAPPPRLAVARRVVRSIPAPPPPPPAAAARLERDDVRDPDATPPTRRARLAASATARAARRPARVDRSASISSSRRASASSPAAPAPSAAVSAMIAAAVVVGAGAARLVVSPWAPSSSLSSRWTSTRFTRATSSAASMNGSLDTSTPRGAVTTRKTHRSNVRNARAGFTRLRAAAAAVVIAAVVVVPVAHRRELHRHLLGFEVEVVVVVVASPLIHRARHPVAVHQRRGVVRVDVDVVIVAEPIHRAGGALDGRRARHQTVLRRRFENLPARDAVAQATEGSTRPRRPLS